MCSSPLFPSNGSLLQVPIIWHLCFVDELACWCLWLWMLTAAKGGAWCRLREWGMQFPKRSRWMFVCLCSLCRRLYLIERLIEFNEKITVKIESRDLLLLFHRRSPCYVVCVLLSEPLCGCTCTSCAYCLWVTLCQMKRSFISAIGSNLGCRTVSPTSSSVSAAVIWGFDRLPGECERWR